MKNNFVSITDSESFEQLLKDSEKQPVVVFKHSTTCPISSGAYREMKGFPGEVALVEIQSAREVSREVGTRTGVEHESPQVIVLRNGKAVWHASHWKITAEAVEQAVQANT
jgi:bacillithiol system protein YtxJ